MGATILSPRWGWVLDALNFCYHNDAPMGATILPPRWGLPYCRPDGAAGLLNHYPSTKMSPRWGWALDALNFCYQNDAPMGLGV